MKSAKNIIKYEINIGFVILLLITLIIIVRYGLLYFNSDTACLNVYIREELRENSYFPQNWYNGEEILLFTPHTFMLPLVRLGASAYSSRIICDVVILLMLAVAVYILSCSVFLDSIIAAMAAILVVANYSIAYIVFMDCQASYSLILLLCCVCLIFFFKSMDDELKVQNWLLFIIFIAINVFCAMLGFRYIQIISIPLLMAIICVKLIERIYESDEDFDLTRAPAVNTIVLMAGIIVSTGIGYCFFAKIASGLIITGPFGGSNALSYIRLTQLDQLDEKFFNAVESYIALAGYEQGLRLISVKTIVILLKCLMFLIMTIVFPVKLAKRYKDISPKIRIFYLFSVFNIFITFAILFLSNLTDELGSERYYIVPSFFLWMTGSFFLFYNYKKKPMIQLLAVTVLVSVLMVNSAGIVHSLNRTENAVKERYHDVVSTLEKENLSFGYATYWNSHIYTVYSDFDIEIAPVTVAEGVFAPFRMLSSPKSFEEDYYTKDTFLMLTKEEDEMFTGREEILGACKKRIELDDYIIYVFDHNISGAFT